MAMSTYQEKSKAAYEAHIAKVLTPKSLKEWAAFMAVRYGNRVKIDHDVYDNWLVALMYVRYGGDESQWPEAFSEADEQRAIAWYKGNAPSGVSYATDGKFDPPMSELLLG